MKRRGAQRSPCSRRGLRGQLNQNGEQPARLWGVRGPRFGSPEVSPLQRGDSQQDFPNVHTDASLRLRSSPPAAGGTAPH